MIAIPAINIRDGMCVPVATATHESTPAHAEDPLTAAHRWEYSGFRRVHIVDLDAAIARESNADVIRDLLRSSSMESHVGGGVRTEERIEQLLADGATRIVLGTRAIESRNWLADMTELFPDTLIVAADVRDRHVLTHGWSSVSDVYVLDLVEELNEIAIAGIMVTAIDRHGTMQGTDVPLMESVVEESVHPVCARGGIGSIGDLRALADRQVASVVIGTALYTGVLDPEAVAEEFAE